MSDRQESAEALGFRFFSNEPAPQRYFAYWFGYYGASNVAQNVCVAWTHWRPVMVPADALTIDTEAAT